MPADSERISDGLSRRQVLARGAVAAGVVWAAPVIRSATAYATSAAGTERPCINFYLVAVDPLGVRPVRFKPDSPYGYDEISDEVLAAMAASTTTTTSSTTTTTTTPAPGAAASQQQPSSPKRSGSRATTTTSTTTTTRAPAPAPPTADESAGQVVADPVPPAPTPTPTPKAPGSQSAASDPVVPGDDAVDDFGLFPDAEAPVAKALPTEPADPHAIAFAAAAGAAAAGAPDNLPPGIKDWLDRNPDVPVRYPSVLPMVTQTGDEAWAVVLAAVDGPDPLTHQCRGVNGWAQSKGKYAEFFIDPNPGSAEEFGRRLIFPNPRVEDLAEDPSALIENVIFVFCCPQ